MVTDGFGSRHGAGQLPGLDDSSATQLHCLQEEDEEEEEVEKEEG